MIEVFHLSTSVNPEEIGYAYPQVETQWDGLEFWGPNSVTSTPLEGPINFKVIFPKFKLFEHAKATDLISTINTSGYLMISERLFRLFTEFKMDAHQ
jgi:hypothetical protein